MGNPRLTNSVSSNTNGVLMSDETKQGLQSPFRRKLLMGMAALPALTMLPRPSFGAGPATSAVNTTGLAVTDTEVTVGILHSATGTMAISETGSIEAEKLAIEQINAMGGVLGRKIKFIQEDGASDWPTFAEKAKKLLVNDKVAAIMGCWTSASRKAVLPVFEQYNGMLYYPTFYEGLEQSKNVIYTGQEATQQILAGLDWIAKEKSAKTFFFIGSDYIWPRTSNKIARKHIENVLKGKVVGEEYYPLGNTQFNSVINKIKLTKPDVIFTDVVGGSNVAFYKQLKAAGVDLSKQTLLTISVTEDEIDGIGGENIAGAYACMKYFQSLDNPNNKTFVAAFKKMWGEKTVIGDVTQAAYLGPWLWKLTVREGGQLRRRQDRGGFARRRVQGRARRLRAHPRKPSPLVQDPRRPRQARRSVRGDLRDRRSDRAGSVPQGLPVSAGLSRPFQTSPWRGPQVHARRPRVASHARRGTSSRRRTWNVRRLFDWRSRLDLRHAGLCRPDPVLRLRADGARAGDHLRPDGRHQHGPRRVHDHRRLRHLDDVEYVPALSAGAVPRLLLPRDGAGLRRLRRAGNAGRMGADPASLQASARHAAGDLGPQPDPAAGLSLDLRRARSRRRAAAMDAGLAARSPTASTSRSTASS